MKINENYLFRTVAGESIVVPVGEAALQVRGLIRLSESGGILFQRLQQGCEISDLIRELQQHYEIGEEIDVLTDVEQFLNQMRSLHMLIKDDNSRAEFHAEAQT